LPEGGLPEGSRRPLQFESRGEHPAGHRLPRGRGHRRGSVEGPLPRRRGAEHAPPLTPVASPERKASGRSPPVGKRFSWVGIRWASSERLDPAGALRGASRPGRPCPRPEGVQPTHSKRTETAQIPGGVPSRALECIWNGRATGMCRDLLPAGTVDRDGLVPPSRRPGGPGGGRGGGCPKARLSQTLRPSADAPGGIRPGKTHEAEAMSEDLQKQAWYREFQKLNATGPIVGWAPPDGRS